MVRAVGHTLPDGLSSEQILARRYWLDLQPNSQQELTEFLRSSYDASLTRQIGGRWFAGRIFASQTDALSFIKSQPNLITEHMNTVMSILAKEPDARTRTRILEEARYNFAAALDDLLNGRLVASLMDAGDIARSLGRTFNRECATLSTED
ncbi:hypothetical protein CYG49_00185, partial [Candidatus Saccharibacteria bacterium]